MLGWADDHDRIAEADGDLAAALTRAHIAAPPPPGGYPGAAGSEMGDR